MELSRKKKILFLCIGNSARSQMAEGFLRHLSAGRFQAFSAGTEPRTVHPLAMEVMLEKGIDISRQYAKGLDEVNLAEMDVVITLCEEAEQRCPVLPVKAKKYHWFLPDPAKAKGSKKDNLEKFIEIRDKIEKKVKELIEKMSN